MEVVVVDDLDPSVHTGPPDHLHAAATLVRASVNDVDAMERALRRVDAVSHHAAKVGLGVDIGDVRDYVRTNDLGTASLLLAMHRSRFRGRLVLASSMVVYGEGRYRCPVHAVVPAGARTLDRLAEGHFEPPCPACGRDLAPEAVPEDAPPAPRNVYAATKLHQEHLCEAFARETGIPFVALRYHNVYGARMPRDTPYAGVASIFRSALARGTAPNVLEDGGQLRDFVHVRDVARANLLALTAGPEIVGPFNVCSGTPRTVGEMAGALAAAFDSGRIRPVITGGARPGDVRHVFASPTRAADVLGFRSVVPFDAGMRDLARAPLRGDREAAAVRLGR
jgi:dTDP-L-rhamnose 4-epimerase